MQRRRYDTGALVGDMKRERRNAVLLSLVGVTILVFLVVYFTRLRGTAVPEVPAVSGPVTPASSPAPLHPAASNTSVTPPASTPAVAIPASAMSAATKPAAVVSAMVQISLPKPGPVLIDGEVVAKKAKNYEAQLSPGKHKVATRIGHKVVQLPVEVAAGRHYQVDLDPKKKKGAVAEIGP